MTAALERGERKKPVPARRMVRMLLACALWASAGGLGRAQTPAGAGDPIRAALRVQAPLPCATVDSIAARVHERSSKVEFADDARLVLRIELRADRAGNVGAELRVEWPDGRRAARSLTAPTCAAGVDALALLIALTLDPSARDDAARQTRGEGEPATPRAAGERGADARDAATATDREAAPVAPQPAPPVPAADAADAANAAPAVAATTPRNDDAANAAERDGDNGEHDGEHDGEGAEHDSDHADPFRVSYFGIGLAAQAVLGVAPRAMPGIAASARIAWNGAGWWAPLLQLQLSRSWARSDEALGVARFRLDAAQLTACVAGLRGRWFAARACASGTLGSLSAAGSDTYDPASHARLWASLGVDLLLSADLVGPLQLVAGAGAGVPLSRDRFAFAPAVFHRVAAVCAGGQLGLGLRFP